MRILSLHPTHNAAKNAFSAAESANGKHLTSSKVIRYEDVDDLVKFFAIEDIRDLEALSGLRFDLVLGLNNVPSAYQSRIRSFIRRANPSPVKG